MPFYSILVVLKPFLGTKKSQIFQFFLKKIFWIGSPLCKCSILGFLKKICRQKPQHPGFVLRAKSLHFVHTWMPRKGLFRTFGFLRCQGSILGQKWPFFAIFHHFSAFSTIYFCRPLHHCGEDLRISIKKSSFKHKYAYRFSYFS